MSPTFTPPTPFTITHNISTFSLATLSGLMIVTPHLYHKHIIRSSNPSTTDLFITTQFTSGTQNVLHSTIRSNGILLLGTTIGLFATRHHYSSSFSTMAAVTASVAVGHLYLLKDVITTPILRSAWLKETERVTKMSVVIGVNLLTAGIGIWAGLSYGGWPWTQHGGYFSSPVINSAGAGASGAGTATGLEDLDLDKLVNTVAKGVLEITGGVTGLVKGFLSKD